MGKGSFFEKNILTDGYTFFATLIVKLLTKNLEGKIIYR